MRFTAKFQSPQLATSIAFLFISGEESEGSVWCSVRVIRNSPVTTSPLKVSALNKTVATFPSDEMRFAFSAGAVVSDEMVGHGAPHFVKLSTFEVSTSD